MPSNFYNNNLEVDSSLGQVTAEYYTADDLDRISITYGYLEDPAFGLSDKDRVELHVYDISNNHLFSDHQIEGWSIESDLEQKPVIVLNVRNDLKAIGFTKGVYRIVYNFHRDVVGRNLGPKFEVKTISSDRKEVRLVPLTPADSEAFESNELDDFYSDFQQLMQSSGVSGPFTGPSISNNQLWTQLHLNLGYNFLPLVGAWVVNDIFPPDPLYPNTILLKFYDKLPASVKPKLRCWLTAEASQPAINKCMLDEPIINDGKTLASPNFDLCLDSTPRVQTAHKTQAEILGSESDLANELVNAYSSSREGVTLNIDYSILENYVHFSSAEQRLDNFIYKLKLINGYDTRARDFDYSEFSSQDVYIYEYTGSHGSVHTKRYQRRWVNKKLDLINNFDDWEKWLYFDSGSQESYITTTGSRGGGEYDWSRSAITPFPKLSGSYKNDLWTEDYLEWNVDQLFDWAVHSIFIPGPNYELLHLTSSKSANWLSIARTTASAYDRHNPNILRKTVPEYLSDVGKDANETYLRFTDMVGQAHDIPWTYTRAFTDKASRLHNENYKNNSGMSDDILYHVGKSQGIEFVDGDPNQQLWEYKLGKDSEGFVKQNAPTASIKTMPAKQRTREVWRRILNNLPFLLKSKGTRMGIRGLINCYGVPEEVLPIYEYGSSKQSDQTTLYEEQHFKYCLNFHKSQSVSTYWGPHHRTTHVTSSAITPNAVEFRMFPNANTPAYSQSLWQVDNRAGIRLHRSYSSAVKLNGQPEAFTEYGHFSLILSSSQGYVSASTGKAKIFQESNIRRAGDGWWTVLLNRVPNNKKQTPYGAYHSASMFNYTLTAVRAEYGTVDQAVSCSFQVTGATNYHSASMNQSYSGSLESGRRAYLGGFVTTSGNYYGSQNHKIFGDPFSGSMQELRYYAAAISHSVLVSHTLAPEMYSSNNALSTYSDLLLRLKLSDRVNHYSGSVQSPSSSQLIQNLAPDQQSSSLNFGNTNFVTYGTANNYPLTFPYGYTEERYYIDTPELGPNSYTSDKIRREENRLIRQLSPIGRAEKPSGEKYALDSNELGIYFSPTDQVNKDIFNQIGGVQLDDYIGDARDAFRTQYPDLNILNNSYWRKYTQDNNKNLYLEQLRLYDMSLFTMIKQFLPARTNADLGVVIEPHFIERPKVLPPGRMTITGDTKPQNIATNAGSFRRFSQIITPAATTQPQQSTLGFVLQPQTWTATIGKPNKPPKGSSTQFGVKGKINVYPLNSILKGFSAKLQNSAMVTSSSPNKLTIDGFLGGPSKPLIRLSDETVKSVGIGIDRVLQRGGSAVLSHLLVTSSRIQIEGVIDIAANISQSKYSYTTLPSRSGGFVEETDEFKLKFEPTTSFVGSSRKSEFRQTTRYFYNGNTLSASYGKPYETGGSVNTFAYSKSLHEAEVNDFNLDGIEGLNRMKFKGSKIKGSGFNIDSAETPDGGPVVSFTYGDPNQLITSDPTYGGTVDIL